MPLTTAERAAHGRRGAQLQSARMTPQERTERACKAHLASAVNAVVNRAPELTQEQLTRLRAVLAPALPTVHCEAA